MIKNIVLDIGGVIFDDSDFNLSKLLNKDLEEIKKIAKVAYGGNFKKCLLGQMTVEQHILELQNIEVKNYNIIKYILSYENLKHSFPLMTSTIEVIQELRKRNYKIYLLSNITEASYKYICETIDMEKLFDGGLFSYEEQMVKPNKGFYEKLINKYNLIKEETIFFDDKEKNVIAANEIGIKAIQFKNVKDIYDNLDIDKGSDFMNENKTNINWFPGHMQKTKRQIGEILNLIDVVYELIDARIPYSSKIVDIDKTIKNKPRILIMTKYDLCDKIETNKWIKHYENLGYKVIIANLNTNDSIKEIVNTTNEIVSGINDKRIEKGMKEKQIKALVVGIPNVGKSTLINKMVGKRVAIVGNKPGVTKNLVWLKTNSNILLLDTPGILWPKFEDIEVALNLASMTAIKQEILNIDEIAIHILKKLEKFYPNLLKERYNLDCIDEDICVTYDIIGKKIGAIISGGEIDYDRVSSYILNDIKNEYIKNITFDRMVDYEL